MMGSIDSTPSLQFSFFFFNSFSSDKLLSISKMYINVCNISYGNQQPLSQHSFRIDLPYSLFHNHFQQYHCLNFDICIIVLGLMICFTILFLYCYFGQLVSTSYEQIADCLYETIWYKLRTDLQRHVLLMIQNARRPSYQYHGFDITILNLSAFCRVKSCNFYLIIYIFIMKDQTCLFPVCQIGSQNLYDFENSNNQPTLHNHRNVLLIKIYLTYQLKKFDLCPLVVKKTVPCNQ